MMPMTMTELSKAMAKIDFALLTTLTEGDQLASRPMSNNGDVEYDGDSFYFSWESARTVSDILKNPHIALNFQGNAGLLGKPPLFVAVEGTARIVRDKGEFAEHWTSELEYWFKDGIDTEGMVMIHVHADRIAYWDGEDQGTIKV